MGGGVAVSVTSDWVIHKALYTSGIAFRSGTTAAVLLLHVVSSKTLLACVANVRKPYAPAGLYGLLMRCTVKKQLKTAVASCPEKNRENRAKPRFVQFIYTVHVEKKRCCAVFHTESGAAP